MEEITIEREASIAAIDNPDGSVTMTVIDKPWGPIVTGKNHEEARAMMKEAFHLSMATITYLSNEGVQVEKLSRKDLPKEYLHNIDNRIDNAFKTTA